MEETKNKSDDDFNPHKEIRKVSDVISQPDKFAEVFCNAADNSKKMDGSISKVVVNLLENDNDTKNKIKSLIREVEKEDWRYYIKKIGFLLFSLITFILGMLIQALISKFLG